MGVAKLCFREQAELFSYINTEYSSCKKCLALPSIALGSRRSCHLMYQWHNRDQNLGPLTPMRGPHSGGTLARMEFFRIPGCSPPGCVQVGGEKFQQMWVWVSWGLCSRLQKHLPLVQPSGHRFLGKPQPPRMFSLLFTFSLQVIEMEQDPTIKGGKSIFDLVCSSIDKLNHGN